MRRHGTNTGRRWLLASLIIWPSWLIGGCAPRTSRIIVLPDSEQVFLIEPNQPYTAPWPAAVLSRGRYMALVEAEMELLIRGPR